MKRKFPPTREDGSFCVIAKFETHQDAEDLRDEITKWCKAWVTEQNVESYKHARIDEDGKEWQPFDYFYAYSSPPSVYRAEGTQLWLRFEGMPNSYWWRDWLARMGVSLTQAFPVLLAKERAISYDCNE
jgi:hypothetical protein